MTLAEYLRSSATTYRQFAALLGCDAAQVSRWVTGRRKPSMDMVVRIWRVTGGRVTPNDFLPADTVASTLSAEQDAA